jgi:hypothetical protein
MFVYALVLFVSATCLAAAIIAGNAFDVSPSLFFRDTAATLKGSFATGWLSNFGAVLWFGAAAVLLFAASLVGDPDRVPLFALGSFTLMLGIDDLFLVHEGLFPFIGLPGEILYVAYGLGAAAWLVFCRTEIARTRWGLLVAGIIALGFSVAVDLAYDLAGLRGGAVIVTEDVAKLTGILFWATYSVDCARAAVLRAVAPQRSMAAPNSRMAGAASVQAALSVRPVGAAGDRRQHRAG